MKKRSTVQRIVVALRRAAIGTPVSEITRKMGVGDPTFYRRKKLYSGMGISDVRRLKQTVADFALDKEMRQDVLSKKLRGLPSPCRAPRIRRYDGERSCFTWSESRCAS